MRVEIFARAETCPGTKLVGQAQREKLKRSIGNRERVWMKQFFSWTALLSSLCEFTLLLFASKGIKSNQECCLCLVCCVWQILILYIAGSCWTFWKILMQIRYNLYDGYLWNLQNCGCIDTWSKWLFRKAKLWREEGETSRTERWQIVFGKN